MMRGGRRGAAAVHAACKGSEGSRLESERRARAECTRNISPMIVTRDVSQSSGWLNRTASCRVKRGGYDARRSAGGRT